MCVNFVAFAFVFSNWCLRFELEFVFLIWRLCFALMGYRIKVLITNVEFTVSK